MARILVTGGAGYIGSVCCDLLLAAGHQVVVLDDLSTGHADALHPRARFHHASIGDPRAVREAAAGCEALFHFAAKALIPESLRDPAAFYDVNVGQSLVLLDAVRRAGIARVVFSSSAAVYGQGDRGPLREQDELRPVNPYGETKLALEQALRWYASAYAWTAFAFRYFCAAGATAARGERHEPETHVIPLLLEAAAGRRPAFEVYGDDYPTADGTCERDFVHVADIAAAHALALRADLGTGLHVFNLGAGRAISVHALWRLAQEITARPIPRRVIPRRPGDPARLCAAADKVERQLGWRPHNSLRDMLTSAWNWMHTPATVGESCQELER